ncbi:MAG: hypothetical protein K9L24_03470 [Spirochaetia bacterium]|nr:hypothetical protein [Spirochaetia bacterium]MCF7945893.1 hypothetical protein [Spirochaetia bacterium]
MNNPWIDLPAQTPYVLEIDSHIIREMDIRYNEKKFEVALDLIPEP